MAVTQISRIQHRRGLEQDLPQLASAELGWSVDTRQLYIGNGTLEEGAPVVGVTRILTEHDINDISSNLSIAVNNTQYTFAGNSAGYTAQTGPSSLAPVIRSYQQKFDDVINIRDFGAIGDNSSDDTDAINRALQEIYKSTVSPTDARSRRTIYCPGGTYRISNTLLIPTFAKLVGDGPGSTNIIQINGNKSVANICDSLFQSGASIGTNSAILPINIEINGINFFNSNTSITEPIFRIDSASNLKVVSCKFTSNSAAGSYPNLISVLSTTSSSTKITIENCQFIGGGNAIALTGTSVNSVRVSNSWFTGQANSAAHLGTSTGFVSIGNYFDTTSFVTNGNNFNLALGDYYQVSNQINAGLYLGNCIITPTQEYTLTTTPTVFSTLANSAGIIEYEMKSGSNIRFGTLRIATQGATLVYSDEYNETPTGVNANLFANNDSILASVNSGTATYKFTYKRFV